jgi:poly(beta-D-mannuronate) lyase
LLALLFVTPLPAAEITVADPAEFQAAVKRVAPGDTLLLKAGIWRDADLVFEAVGTAEKPITMRPAQPGSVVLSGKSRVSIGGSHLTVEGLVFREAFHPEGYLVFRRDSKRLAEHCRVTRCSVIDCNPPVDDTKKKSTWVSLYGNHNRFDHCHLEGKTNPGTTLVVWLPETEGSPNEHAIDHNYFGRRPELKKNGGETIRIGDSDGSMQASRTTVEANLFEECDGEAEIISNKSCENIYRGNTFRRCSGALTLRHGNRSTIEENFFLGEKARGTGGVRVIGEGHRIARNYFADLMGDDTRAGLSIMNGVPDSKLNQYFQVKNAAVEDNVFLNCKETFVVGLADNDSNNVVPPADVTISGNVVVAGRRKVVSMRDAKAGVVWSDNIYSGEDLGVTASADAWMQQDIRLGLRNGIEWPETPEARGPSGKPLERSDVGPDAKEANHR